MISLSLSPPFLWLDFFFVFLAIAPFVISSPIAPFPALPPPPPPHPPAQNSKSSTTFKPGVAVVIGILTTVFSVTFLVLLYTKHCKGGSGGESGVYRSGVLPPPPADLRKNSGIDRTVIESLPVFRFGALRGHKEGLECAVCLNRFEPNEVLRLLPKCRHGFHVECVDTWLDAHSTCPLCRYRVDPEDVLLVMDPSVLQRASQEKPQMASPAPEPVKGKETGNFRASGRHSWAGERGPVSSLQIIVENPGGGRGAQNTTPFNGRRSLDSWKKKSNGNGNGNGSGKNNNHETVSFGCLDRANRKDGLLLADKTDEQQQQRRLEHRIIVSDASGPRYRWSDVEPSDSLYLQSGSLFSESRRFSEWRRSTAVAGSGRSVINGRSVSEITGVSRFRSYEEEEEHKERRRQRQEGAVTRWLAWIAHYPSQSARTSGRSDQPPDSLTT